MGLRLKVHYIFLLLLCGCTAKGYTGADLPKEKLANISLSLKGSVTIEKILVDDLSLSTLVDSVDVLPGKRRVELYYYTEYKGDCYDNSSFCFPTVTRGKCQGEVELMEGRKYLLTLEFRYPILDARFLPKGYFDFAVRTDEPSAGSVFCG